MTDCGRTRCSGWQGQWRNPTSAATIGDLTGARQHDAAGAELHTRLLDYEGSAYGLSGLANLALAQDRPQAAARLIGASAHAREVVGAAVWPGMKSSTDALATAVDAALGSTSFAAACAEGARLRIPEAFGYGLAATAADAALDPFSLRMVVQFETRGVTRALRSGLTPPGVRWPGRRPRRSPPGRGSRVRGGRGLLGPTRGVHSAADRRPFIGGILEGRAWLSNPGGMSGNVSELNATTLQSKTGSLRSQQFTNGP